MVMSFSAHSIGIRRGLADMQAGLDHRAAAADRLDAGVQGALA